MMQMNHRVAIIIDIFTIIVAVTGIAFVLLKLFGVIGWQWLWVVSPFWIATIILLLVILISFVYMGIKERKNNRRYY